MFIATCWTIGRSVIHIPPVVWSLTPDSTRLFLKKISILSESSRTVRPASHNTPRDRSECRIRSGSTYAFSDTSGNPGSLRYPLWDELITTPFGTSTRAFESGTRSWSTDLSEFLTKMPVAPESSANRMVPILGLVGSLFLFKKVKVGSVFIISVIRLQELKAEPLTQFFLFLNTSSQPPLLFLAVAVATCPGLGNLHDLESWLPVPWDQQ